MDQETIDRLRNVNVKTLRNKLRGSGLYSRNPKYWEHAGFNKEDSAVLARSRMPGTYEYFLIYKKQTISDSIDNSTKAKNRMAITIENMQMKYGESEGRKRFDIYCEKQRYKNTFESKRDRYGWDKNKFDEYNRSRAITVDNMVSKYGESEGFKRYNVYCEKQKFTKSLEYLIDKYGEDKGTEKFKEINILKSHSLQSYIIRNDGNLLVAKEQYNNFWKNKNTSYSSECSTVFFRNLVIYCGLDISKCHYSDVILGKKEYGICLADRYIFVDFFYKNKVIEFNGDYWHANPKYYKDTDTIKYPQGIKNVKDIWNSDRLRREKIKETRGFDVMTVWQDDVIEKPEECLKICKEFLQR